jgi:sulfatase modifying factor 1
MLAMRSATPRWRRARTTGVVVVLALALSCDLTVSLKGLDGGCPPTRGPSQVMITSGSSPFCVDSTEVTNTDYAQFIASGFVLPASEVRDGCEGLADSTPSAGWPPLSGEGNFPVSNVNWCQAYAYCAWAGKRLCGEIGGGPLAVVNQSVASDSQWLNACSLDGKRTYPYGDTFTSTACGGQAAGTQQPDIVASQAGCVGSVAGLHDMSGNVWEWTDACGAPLPNDAGAAGAFCSAMGGAFDSTQEELECTGQRNWTRSNGAANIGIRCCLDL